MTPGRPTARALAAGLALVALLPASGLAARYRVCAFSFHNPDEVATIRAALPPDQFEFVDLSPDPFGGDTPVLSSDPTGAAAPADGGAAEPFPLNLCRADLQCDVLVIAGEFAGRFFGKTGASLGLQEMDEAACQARCAGLFRAPREVFMLACNTLATKDQDRRTPDEYRHVLLEHGFDAATAERVVELRYGPLGQSFRESLRRVFMGVPRLYGFSSVAPVGLTTAPMLAQYFREMGDYGAYLATAGRTPVTNQTLLRAFRGTGMVQSTGLDAGERGAADRVEICALYDESRDVLDRLAVVRRLFDRPDLLSFLPTIDVFLSRHPPQTLQGPARAAIDDIRRHDAARTQVVGLVQRLQVSALKLELAHLARQLDWLTAAEFRTLAVDGARELLARGLTSEVVDVMCETTRHEYIGDAFVSADVPGLLFTHAEGLRLIDCLSPADPAVSARLAVSLDHPDPSARAWAAYALSRRLPLAEPVLRAVIGHLGETEPEVRDRLRSIVRLHGKPAPPLLELLRQHDAPLADELTPRRRFHLF